MRRHPAQALQVRVYGRAARINICACECCERVCECCEGVAAGRGGALMVARRRVMLGWSRRAGGLVGGQLSHKYPDEGISAIVHATALSLPGSRWVAAGDGTPRRLHIELTSPPGVGVGDG